MKKAKSYVEERDMSENPRTDKDNGSVQGRSKESKQDSFQVICATCWEIRARVAEEIFEVEWAKLRDRLPNRCIISPKTNRIYILRKLVLDTQRRTDGIASVGTAAATSNTGSDVTVTGTTWCTLDSTMFHLCHCSIGSPSSKRASYLEPLLASASQRTVIVTASREESAIFIDILASSTI